MRSTATEIPGLPELDQDLWRHIKERQRKEKPRKQRSQAIIMKYEEFHVRITKKKGKV